jgi:hypothetical protein
MALIVFLWYCVQSQRKKSKQWRLGWVFLVMSQRKPENGADSHSTCGADFLRTTARREELEQCNEE